MASMTSAMAGTFLEKLPALELGIEAGKLEPVDAPLSLGRCQLRR